MNKQTNPTPQQDNDKIKVLVNLGVYDPDKADFVAKKLGFDSRSAYLRNRIHRDYMRLMRDERNEANATK